MVREVLTLNVGQAGIQCGQTLWESYCAEHNLNHQDIKQSNDNNMSFPRFFEETDSGHCIARNLMIDLDSDIIDNLQYSKYSKIFHPQYLLTNQEDAAGNFARGHYTVGKELIGDVNDRLRLLVDNCDNFQGFLLNNAVGGGTGSGLGALILENIAVNYRKKSRLGFHIYPFNNQHSMIQTEAYNAMLSTHWYLDYTDVSFIFDNRKLYNICDTQLHVANPNYYNLNCIISKVISGITADMRFDGELNVDLDELQRNVNTGWSQRLHFMTTSLSPIINRQTFLKNKTLLVDGFVRQNVNDRIHKMEMESLLYKDLMNIIYSAYDVSNKLPELTVWDICEQSFNSDNFMIECLDFDVDEDTYMTISMNYRGNVTAKEANAAFQKLKGLHYHNRKLTISEYSSRTCFKIGLNENMCSVLDNDCVEFPDKSAVMIGNNELISRFFTERISNIYDKMYSQRAFVHWYVGEGMEEGEFAEAREDLGFLEKDYLDCFHPQDNYDYDDESD